MSVRCLRFREFRENPSMFHVKEENDFGDITDEEDDDCEEAPTARVGLSEHSSLTVAGTDH